MALWLTSVAKSDSFQLWQSGAEGSRTLGLYGQTRRRQPQQHCSSVTVPHTLAPSSHHHSPSLPSPRTRSRPHYRIRRRRLLGTHPAPPSLGPPAAPRIPIPPTIARGCLRTMVLAPLQHPQHLWGITSTPQPTWVGNRRSLCRTLAKHTLSTSTGPTHPILTL